MYKTEDFYKTVGGRFVSFSACKRHARQLTYLLGTMEGSSIDVNEGEWRNTGTGPCLICMGRKSADLGLITVLYDRIVGFPTGHRCEKCGVLVNSITGELMCEHNLKRV